MAPPTTARQYGAAMRAQGIKWPAPAIGKADALLSGLDVFRIGRRDPSKVFVLARNKWATVYVERSYGTYRDAFDAVMPRTSLGRDVDHLLPKSQAPAGDFLALGRISHSANRSWNDSDSDQAMAQKVRDMIKANPHQFVSQLTDMERGWAVVSCYIRPLHELNTSAMTKMTMAEREEAFSV
ncbi:hypothetical protein [uncultured Tateyamaria sp.]|uniref:hypothetical protein n=1 Tax=Tateyamaria sp. 1078 TaxID=3417464 RepID=UPI002601DA3A|nr:hypothetical protein [uncultured Tateyamaria sp.]